MSEENNQKPLPEPWRVKVVEAIALPSERDREKYLKKAGYNIFALPSEAVYIDLLTDSGMSAMSDQQWAGMMRGDESYAGSRSFYVFEAAIREIFGFPHVIPTYHGRMAESLLFSSVLKPGDIVPGNMLFDTTHASIESNSGTALDLPIPEAADPLSPYPFKGNMDTARLVQALREHPLSVPLVMLTMANSPEGGQPVSLENIRAVKEICEKNGIPLIMDACRFAENAYFIREREDACKNWTIMAIVREMFTFADGCTASAREDGLANVGGFLALREEKWIPGLTGKMAQTETFPAGGGLTGRDLEVIARGLREAVDERYLEFRVGQVRYLSHRLTSAGVPVLTAAGGHAVDLDARAFLPNVAPSACPAQALAAALYRGGGIRTAPIVSSRSAASDRQVVRLTIPRRVYSTAHLDYVADVVQECFRGRDEIRGLKVVSGTPAPQHFTTEFEPL